MVIVDYFTKWVEAMSTYTNATRTTAQIFFNHVITSFGVPKELVSDHGKHFENEIFWQLSQHLYSSHEFASTYYPQSNNLVEFVNKVLKMILQRMVKNHKTNWHHMVL